MNRIIHWIQNYLVYALPFVFICMAWGAISPEKETLQHATFFTKASWELLSFNLMLWFVVLILFLILLLFMSQTREKTLKRLANLQERDEREQFITGQASKNAYVSTLSLMILLLFFSIFSLKIYRAPETEAVNGKTGTVAIGFRFDLLDKPRFETDSENKVILESKDIPLSKTAIILLIIVWHLVGFNISARKENAKQMDE